MSLLLTPFYLPLVGLMALFFLSYLSLLPLSYRLWVLGIVYLSTILAPTLTIRLYRQYQGWTPIQLGLKERRMVPYVISILCYFGCYYLMTSLRMPTFMARILMAALLIQVVCAVINIWWKISTHTAGIGGVTGALVAFSLLFSFDPTGWLSLVIILSGMVASSRIILRQHTLAQVLVGYAVGVACGFVAII